MKALPLPVQKISQKTESPLSLETTDTVVFSPSENVLHFYNILKNRFTQNSLDGISCKLRL